MRRQKGITLIGAIFVLVIVSMLGIFLVNITNSQRQSVLMNLQSARAYQAANAGIEWGISRLINASSCAASTELANTINNFTVTVTCTELNPGGYNEAGETINIYRVSSLSEYGVYTQSNYISRQLETIIHN